MKTLNNEKGVALVTTLVLSLVAFGMIMGLLYMLLQQTKVSGAHKRYKTSLEAAHGGVELVTKELIPLMFSSASDPKTTLTSRFASVNLDTSANNCLNQKLTLVSSGWTACGSNSKSFDAKQDYDMTFKLQGTSGPGYQVYAKIVDTQPGNSDTSGMELLDSGAGVTGSSAGVSPKHVPAIYRIETEGESRGDSKEKAALTVFYSY